MICDILLKGVVDDEIPREIFGSTDVFIRAVNEIFALKEGKEMAHNAVPSTETTFVLAVKRPYNADYRARCNATPRPESINSPARSNNHVVRSANDSIPFTKKGLLVGIPTLHTPCILTATRRRDTEGIISLRK